MVQVRASGFLQWMSTLNVEIGRRGADSEHHQDSQPSILNFILILNLAEINKKHMPYDCYG